MKKILLLCLAFLNMSISFSQNKANENSLYNPQDYFLPTFSPVAGNEFRSANGTPGPMYWQNSADYLIRATLSEKDSSISGDVTISYTNNSPDQLDYIWMQLDQNMFDPASRGTAATPVSGTRFEGQNFSLGGFKIADVTVTANGKTYTVQPVITDTRMHHRAV